jgi:hypothetical protein
MILWYDRLYAELTNAQPTSVRAIQAAATSAVADAIPGR